MPRNMKIDFVSDIACPWCAVGLNGLETALSRLGDVVDARIVFQPFELNPDMPPGGEDGTEHIARKYGLSAEQVAASRETIKARAAAVGFDMGGIGERRLYNTFDAPTGEALNASLVDLGNRFRLIINEVTAVKTPKLPKLPVTPANWYGANRF